MEELCLDELRIPALSDVIVPKERIKVPRHRQGELFLKGPVPWQWLRRAAALPGRALHVGVTLWVFAGMKGPKLKLSYVWLHEQTGIDRFAGERGLQALEKAGLIAVERHRGRKPVVTLLPAAELSD